MLFTRKLLHIIKLHFKGIGIKSRKMPIEKIDGRKTEFLNGKVLIETNDPRYVLKLCKTF